MKIRIHESQYRIIKKLNGFQQIKCTEQDIEKSIVTLNLDREDADIITVLINTEGQYTLQEIAQEFLVNTGTPMTQDDIHHRIFMELPYPLNIIASNDYDKANFKKPLVLNVDSNDIAQVLNIAISNIDWALSYDSKMYVEIYEASKNHWPVDNFEGIVKSHFTVTKYEDVNKVYPIEEVIADTDTKTIREWYSTVKHPGVRKQLLLSLLPEHRDTLANTLSDAILNGFKWNNTKQGRGFWTEIHYLYSQAYQPIDEEVNKFLKAFNIPITEKTEENSSVSVNTSEEVVTFEVETDSRYSLVIVNRDGTNEFNSIRAIKLVDAIKEAENIMKYRWDAHVYFVVEVKAEYNANTPTYKQIVPEK